MQLLLLLKPDKIQIKYKSNQKTILTKIKGNTKTGPKKGGNISSNKPSDMDIV